MVYKQCRIYGPYSRKDGRKHIIAIFPSGKRKTVSYPKYLMEKKLNRYLKPNETVDHVDRDLNNNDFSNLEIKERVLHAKEDVIRLKPKKFICPICGEEFVLESSRLSDAIANRKMKKAGPFCNRSCAGKYGAKVQNGSKKSKVKIIEPTYTRNTKIQLIVPI